MVTILDAQFDELFFEILPPLGAAIEIDIKAVIGRILWHIDSGELRMARRVCGRDGRMIIAGHSTHETLRLPALGRFPSRGAEVSQSCDDV